jgi:glycosyltransferase involved in cell wall biosynthesis
MRAPAAELVKLGVDVTVEEGVDAEAIRHPDGMVDVKEVRTDADLIVVQRPLDNSINSLVKQAQRQGIAVVVELDDDFSMVHKNNVAHSVMYGKTSGHEWVQKSAEIADHVTISTPQLEKYARHGRSSILRNCVPESIFNTVGQKSEVLWPRIGWTGSVQTHPTDLLVTKGAVATILEDNDLPFMVVGDGESVQAHLGMKRDQPVYNTGWVPLDEYYTYLASFIDVGIVPLEISPFNQAKSALKGLEFAALGIPFVASPTREYIRLEAHGVGKTAKTPGEWRKHLQRMIDRPAETERIANEARDRIKAEHTYSVNAPQWLEAWEKAIDYRKTQPS